MLFGYFTLFVALLIEVVGAYYSITGLAAIFSGAIIPILIMGGVLELGKVTAAVWLKNNWHRASVQFKAYLLPAVIMLMFITSMGIFGFLSKAHNDQTLVSGDVGSKLAIYDEKIKTAKENIESDRKQLKQMDEAVDQVMSRSTDEKGADKSNAIRRSQQRDRSALAKSIETNQKLIATLNEEAAPIRAEVRKVEAEVGPIKYIAALIYGDNPDANLLERAVVWMILIIVAVFDPLALVLILAAQQSIRWAKQEQEEVKLVEPTEEPVTKNYVDNILGEMRPMDAVEQKAADDALFEEYYNNHPAVSNTKHKVLEGLDSMWSRAKNLIKRDEEAEHAPIEPIEAVEDLVIDDHIEEEHDQLDPVEKEARRKWKEANPGETIKHHRRLFETGMINELPWMHPDYYNNQLGLVADNIPTGNTGEVKGFGTSFPAKPVKGDMFLRVDQLPSALYKFNGTNWIEIDKALSDQHAYDEAYIDHLISKIETGEYDPELLSDAERASIEDRLSNNPRGV